MMNSNAELRLDPESQTLVAQPQARPSLKDLAKVKNIFAPNVYIKAFFVPKGMRVITKAFREDHVTILATGSVLVEDPEGKKIKYVAPVAIHFKEQTRYRATTLEDAVWYCVHPTQETDQEALIKMYE
jgi:hypothetical protein